MQRLARWLLLVSVLIFSTSAVFAADVLVDCSGTDPGSYPSLSAALAALAPAGPNSVGIIGTCADNAYVFGYSDLWIYGADTSSGLTAANPNRVLLIIDSSSRVFLVGLTFVGGRGVFVANNSNVVVSSVTIQNSSRQGLVSSDSFVQVDTTTIANNDRNGLYVDGGAVLLNGGVNVSGNKRSGAVVVEHAKFTASDGGPGFPNIFENNQAAGIAADGTCYLNLTGDNRVLTNGSYGIEVLHTTTLYLMAGAQVVGNAGAGIHVGETSHGEFSEIVVQNNGTGTGSPGIEVVNNSDVYIDGQVHVIGNGAQGIMVDWGSVLASLGGNTIAGNSAEGVFVHANGTVNLAAPDTITGNGKADVACDTTSLISGDLTGVTNLKCARVERGTGRQYPGRLLEKP